MFFHRDTASPGGRFFKEGKVPPPSFSLLWIPFHKPPIYTFSSLNFLPLRNKIPLFKLWLSPPSIYRSPFSSLPDSFLLIPPLPFPSVSDFFFLPLEDPSGPYSGGLPPSTNRQPLLCIPHFFVQYFYPPRWQSLQ